MKLKTEFRPGWVKSIFVQRRDLGSGRTAIVIKADPWYRTAYGFEEMPTDKLQEVLDTVDNKKTVLEEIHLASYDDDVVNTAKENT